MPARITQPGIGTGPRRSLFLAGACSRAAFGRLVSPLQPTCPPIGVEPFRLVPFLFRTVAGIYLAVVFWFRGYGPAAGCHAAYNLDLVFLDVLVHLRGSD